MDYFSYVCIMNNLKITKEQIEKYLKDIKTKNGKYTVYFTGSIDEDGNFKCPILEEFDKAIKKDYEKDKTFNIEFKDNWYSTKNMFFEEDEILEIKIKDEYKKVYNPNFDINNIVDKTYKK